jgi:hypothetical protein
MSSRPYAATKLLQCVPEQPVCLGGLRFGLHVIAAIKLDRVECVRRQERDHVDRAGCPLRQRGKLVVAEHDRLSGRRLVSAGDLDEPH